MNTPLSIGCVVYGVSAIIFSLAVLTVITLTIATRRVRSRKIGHLSLGEKLSHPPVTAERPLRRATLHFLIAGLLMFTLGAGTDAFGLSLGMFGGETACPAPWPTPRSLRALQ